MKERKRKIKYELIREFAIVAVIPLLISSIAAVNYFVKSFTREMQQGINSDLESAIHVYGKVKDDLKYLVRDQNRAIFTLYKRGELPRLRKHLEGVVWKNQLSFFTVTDNRGKVFLRVSNPSVVGDDLSADPLIQEALKDETIVTMEIASEEELEREGLLEKAKIDLVETPGAKPLTKKVETQGLVLKVVMPVKDEVHRIVGVMSGGYLLNRNYPIVDLISEKIGAKTTIFLNHTRIATNVLNLDGSRAIGTRISEKVEKEVLELGKRYTGRAWVVNAWYITAYEPIKDIHDKVIGALYVGAPEAPLIALRNRMIAGFALILGFALLAAIAFAFYNSWRITKPIEQLREGTGVIGSGNLEHKIFLKTKNEIGELANAFNKMTESLKEHKEKLEEYARTLEEKLEERTKELVKKEKMATIGELAGSIAHELRNPLGDIKNSIYFLTKILRNTPDERIPEILKIIKRQTNISNQIIGDLLDFSHTPKLTFEKVRVEEAINEATSKVILPENVKLISNLDESLPPIDMDRTLIERVFLNLINNAIQAMSEGGKLTISTRKKGEFIEIEFTDTGQGIPEENLQKIFDPLYSTKVKGTGLGLAISKNFVEKHNGSIEVKSVINQGSSFTVKLPIETVVAHL